MRLARFGALVPGSLLRKKLGALDESVIDLHVWPNEADMTNVNQSVYPLYMELGRWDLALRIGLARVMLRERCVGILGGQAIQYLKPLKRLQAFTLRSRIAGWDKKWTFFEHVVEHDDVVYTISHARILFMNRSKKRISPSRLSAMVNGPSRSPKLGKLPELLESYFNYKIDA